MKKTNDQKNRVIQKISNRTTSIIENNFKHEINKGKDSYLKNELEKYKNLTIRVERHS
jgi:hypothetical protein